MSSRKVVQWMFAALVALAILAPRDTRAGQLVKRIVLKYHATLAAGATDSTSAFSIAGARRVRIVVYSTDIDSSLATGTGLGIAMADSALKNTFRVATASAVLGMRAETSPVAQPVRYAPQRADCGQTFDYFYSSSASAVAAGTQTVAPNLLAKWYTVLLGGSSRATDYNVIAYIYYDNL